MALRRLRALIWVAATVAAGGGCRSGNPEVYPSWTAEPVPYTPREDSANAFDAYALAAVDAEAKGGVSINRVSFFPGQKKDAALAIKSEVDKVLSASKQPCEFKFVAHKPFQPVQYQRGWRLIGRVILWKVEDACEAADYDTAVRFAVAGTRFGFGLTGGGATDASLGLAIADDLRKAIAPSLAKMSAAQLDHLGQGIKAALDAKPAISASIIHERENSYLMIQYLQDAMRSDKLKDVISNLGPDVNEPMSYLGGIADNPSKRTAYFDELAKAAAAETASLEQESEIAASARKHERPKYDEHWRKLAKHIFGSARPLLGINDATMARTRLLVLYAQVTRIGLQHKPFPQDLSAFTPALIIDPYSGAPFIYHADPAEFSIYSVGSNGQDDGGDTDSSFTKPDLRLEIPFQ